MIRNLSRTLPVLFLFFCLAAPAHCENRPVIVTVDLTAGPVNTFIPAKTLGAAVDGHSQGDGAAIFTPETVQAMLSAGFHPISYRLRTELANEAWHWNPKGSWSDAENRCGYWTSDDSPAAPILSSYGYRLPRRGNTIDQAEDNGYSRLADGDMDTFWKSSPYLDQRYTGEENARHPQWVVVDLGRRFPVNGVRIAWGMPYAVQYRVQYWKGRDPEEPGDSPEGRWETFPCGTVFEGRGGDVTHRLADDPAAVRFLRLVLEESSATPPPGGNDPRDALGYAIRELFIGSLDAGNNLRDWVRHEANRRGQALCFVSSTDPWHRAGDLDMDIEQPGLDLVFSSGVTRGAPVLIPAGVLYDTPENAAALLRYLQRREYPVRGIELGEEPDGQYVSPEDFGALYLQAADALRRVDPEMVFGGPSLESQRDGPMMAWAGTGVGSDLSWVSRLLGYLGQRGRSKDLGFFSFEWYPFDDVCAPAAPFLRRAPRLLRDYIDGLRRQGLPDSTPLLITEYGYSAFSAEAEVDLPGALFNADVVGTLLNTVQDPGAAYLYGIEPTPLYKGPKCDTWGNNTLFLSGHDRRILACTATFHGAVMLMRNWIGDPAQPHAVYPVKAELKNPADPPFTAYALHRPGSSWALLLVNKDPLREWTVAPRFAGPQPGKTGTLEGSCDVYRFSRAQYRWKSQGAKGRPQIDLPPAHTVQPVGSRPVFRLPPWSLTVISGHLPETVYGN
ncbi:MAG: discoidin domain-containing protein [Syntrophobacteraceae bacterium]